MNIAIFGGAFDPITKDHIDIINKVIDETLIDILYIELAHDSYKNMNTPYYHRAEMIHQILNKFNCDTVFIGKHDGKMFRQPYAIETLNWYSKRYSSEQLFYVIGSDELKVFDSWKDSEKMLQNYNWIVVSRGKDHVPHIIHQSELLRKYKEKIQYINFGGFISSSYVRESVAIIDIDDPDIDEAMLYLIDSSTWDYIKENNLYEYKRS